MISKEEAIKYLKVLGNVEIVKDRFVADKPQYGNLLDYITSSPLDSEVEEALVRIFDNTTWVFIEDDVTLIRTALRDKDRERLRQNDIREEMIQEKIEEILKLQDKLDKIDEIVNKVIFDEISNGYYQIKQILRSDSNE